MSNPFGAERIVAAAIRQDHQTFALPAPARHWNVMQHMMETLGEAYSPPHPADQGFLTSTGRFIQRDEARYLAVITGQVEKPALDNWLYSEDLW